ncbi:MAG TPA: hypothetical protein VFV58_12615 [Blastocatellia bacterium]|jgi:hypothetical protein|nr:hypothetical protein [Blastocatellia bacterium]
MAAKKTARDYAAEVRALKDERDQALEERDEAYSKLEDIDVVLYGEEDEDDDDDNDEE